MSYINKDKLTKSDADRIFEGLLQRLGRRSSTSIQNLYEPKLKHKVIIKVSYEIYVKELGDINYKYRNTFRSSKDIPNEFIKDNRKYQLVDRDENVIFYKEIKVKD